MAEFISEKDINHSSHPPSFLKKRPNIVGIIAGVVGAFLVYFGHTANVFPMVLTLLGVTGLIAMAALLLNVVNTVANSFSKKQERKVN